MHLNVYCQHKEDSSSAGDQQEWREEVGVDWRIEDHTSEQDDLEAKAPSDHHGQHGHDSDKALVATCQGMSQL